jgi:PAS domain S-box-containing protein
MQDTEPEKGTAPTHTRFSSTMRIDLTADADESAHTPSPLARQAAIEITGETPPATTGSPDFRELFDSVYDAAIITHKDGTIICANSRAEEFFEFPAKQFRGMHITDLISGSNENLLPTINSNLEDDRFILIQAFCCRANGSIFPSEVSVNFLKLENEETISFFIRDVTFRKEAEEKLRTGHAAIQNSGNGIAVTDRDGTLRYFNPAMAALLGVSEADNENAMQPYLCNQDIGDTIRRAISAGRAWSGELQMRCKDGSTLVALASVAPDVDADGEVTGMVWSLLDISDQKRIQNELRHHNTQLADDLNLANEFQLAFIQRDYPTFPAGVPVQESVIELSHTYLPSGAVGGDFFEIFAVSLSRVGIFISDVMGHGVRSALIVATIRGLLEELGPFRYDPATFLTHMNRDLARIISHPGQTMFASAFYMVLDLTTGEVEWASAGHPPALLQQADNGNVYPLKPEAENDIAEPALGLFPNTTFHAHNARMQTGDLLLLYTDGIAEAENPTKEDIFDVSGICKSLQQTAGKPVSECLQQIITDAQDFSGSAHFDDDVCLIGMRLRDKLLKTEPL